MPRNMILPNPGTESFKPTAKKTELLTVYFLWLKLAGLYGFNNPKTENICKPHPNIVFKIIFILNFLSYVFIATFCLFTRFVFPTNQEDSMLSLVTLALCLTFAVGRVMLYVYLNKYFRALSDHLLGFQTGHSEPGDQSKCFHFNFWLSIFVLAFPFAIIFALFVSGIALVASSHLESRRYILLKLSLHLSTVQAITQQVAILLLLIGTCFNSRDILKQISKSVKDLLAMNDENLGHSIRSLCHEYSDFIVLMDEFSNIVNPIIFVQTAILGSCIYITIIYYNHIGVFVICELGIFFILGICALLTILVIIDALADDRTKCKLDLISIKLDNVPDEFKTDLCIFQERIFHSKIPLASKLTSLPPLVLAVVFYELKDSLGI